MLLSKLFASEHFTKKEIWELYEYFTLDFGHY